MNSDPFQTIITKPKNKAINLGLIVAFLLLLAQYQRASTDQQQTGETSRLYFPISIGQPPFSIIPIGAGFNTVTDITHAGDERIFVAERSGRVRILHPDRRITTFLDISHRVISNRGEYGFYSIVFHPGYRDPASPGYGFFYVMYTTGFDDGVTLDVITNIERYQVSQNPDIADPASGALIMDVRQAFSVHKGGGMGFDPRDDMLYIGMGDDRLLLISQSDRSPKGKIFRLDVNQVPRNLVGDAQGIANREIWAYGLRNPWRIDVDPVSGLIFVGEVGDQLWEEINIVPIQFHGQNYGWPCMEGPVIIPEANDIPECQNPNHFVRAIHEYAHRDGSGRCAVIGGKVHRPVSNPNDGRYIFADMCTREIFHLTYTGVDWERTLLGILEGELISTIGEDVFGNQYIGTIDQSGPIYRLHIP
jgi:glucose/arabinose dehydrogenase